jgi:flagellin-like protein
MTNNNIQVLSFIRNSLSDRGVSPVISVILMVAITVILAAVIATFVLGIGESTSSEAPSTAFAFEYDDDTGNVIVTHAEGEISDGDQLRFAGAALEKTSFGGITEWSGGDVQAGQEAEVNAEGGEKLQVVWTNEEETNTVILGEYRVPDKAAAGGSITSLKAKGAPPSEVDVSIGSLSAVPGSSAEIVVEDSDGNTVSQSISSSSSTTITALTVDNGETVSATLYETSNQENEIDTATDTAADATLNYVDEGANNDRIKYELGSISTDTGEVYITAKNEDTGEVEKRGPISTTGSQLIVSMDDSITGSTHVSVTVYETSARINELAFGEDNS